MSSAHSPTRKPPKPILRDPPGRANQSFATFLILCSTSFFLGLLFSLFPYDYPLLWTSTPPADPFTPLEQHYLLLAQAPPLIPRILHIIVGVGFLGFLLKLWRATESNMLFDGASLVLYVIGVIIYITNIVKGLRVVAAGEYEKAAVIEHDEADPTRHDVDMVPGVRLEGLLGREDSLKVLSASHTILALVFIGVLVFQAGQWYAERKEGMEIVQQPETVGKGKKKQ